MALGTVFRYFTHRSTPKTCPTISIVTSNYNYATYPTQPLRSVILQNYPNLEYIVIDDGSTDERVAVISKQGERLGVFEQHANQG